MAAIAPSAHRSPSQSDRTRQILRTWVGAVPAGGAARQARAFWADQVFAPRVLPTGALQGPIEVRAGPAVRVLPPGLRVHGDVHISMPGLSGPSEWDVRGSLHYDLYEGSARSGPHRCRVRNDLSVRVLSAPGPLAPGLPRPAIVECWAGNIRFTSASPGFHVGERLTAGGDLHVEILAPGCSAPLGHHNGVGGVLHLTVAAGLACDSLPAWCWTAARQRIDWPGANEADARFLAWRFPREGPAPAVSLAAYQSYADAPCDVLARGLAGLQTWMDESPEAERPAREQVTAHLAARLAPSGEIHAAGRIRTDGLTSLPRDLTFRGQVVVVGSPTFTTPIRGWTCYDDVMVTRAPQLVTAMEDCEIMGTLILRSLLGLGEALTRVHCRDALTVHGCHGDFVLPASVRVDAELTVSACSGDWDAACAVRDVVLQQHPRFLPPALLQRLNTPTHDEDAHLIVKVDRSAAAARWAGDYPGGTCQMQDERRYEFPRLEVRQGTPLRSQLSPLYHSLPARAFLESPEFLLRHQDGHLDLVQDEGGVARGVLNALVVEVMQPAVGAFEPTPAGLRPAVVRSQEARVERALAVRVLAHAAARRETWPHPLAPGAWETGRVVLTRAGRALSAAEWDEVEALWGVHTAPAQPHIQALRQRVQQGDIQPRDADLQITDDFDLEFVDSEGAPLPGHAPTKGKRPTPVRSLDEADQYMREYIDVARREQARAAVAFWEAFEGALPAVTGTRLREAPSLAAVLGPAPRAAGDVTWFDDHVAWEQGIRDADREAFRAALESLCQDAVADPDAFDASVPGAAALRPDPSMWLLRFTTNRHALPAGVPGEETPVLLTITPHFEASWPTAATCTTTLYLPNFSEREDAPQGEALMRRHRDALLAVLAQYAATPDAYGAP